MSKTNLFNFDINQVRCNRENIVLMKLSGDIIYQAPGFYVEYTVHNGWDSVVFNNVTLAESALPLIYTDENTHSQNGYRKITITKLDDTITTDTSTVLSEIKSVKVYYFNTTYAVRFPFYLISTGLENYTHVSPIKTIEHYNPSNFKSTAYAFDSLSEMESINTLGWDTSNIISMAQMFFCCSDLTDLNLSSFNTSNVTNMSYMFQNCSNLADLNLSSFNTGNVINMSYMFSGCSSLTDLDLSSFNTGNVFDMNYMFSGIDLQIVKTGDGFNTGNVTNMSGIFAYCKNTESILKKLNTSNVSDMSFMFNNCNDINLDLSNFNTRNVKSFSGMFNNCKNLSLLDLSNFKDNTSYTTMFMNDNRLCNLILYNCDNDSIVNILSKLNGELPNYTGLKRIIYCKEGATVPTINGWNIEFITSENEKPMPTKHPIYIPAEFKSDYEIETVEISVTKNNTDLTSMFYNCDRLESVDTEGWNTGHITDMTAMFYHCINLTSLDLSSFDTSNVTNMNYMFYSCDKLTDLDLSSFDISKTTRVNNMFYGCTNLTNLNAPKNINTSIAFYSCNSLTHDSLMSIINNLTTVTSTKTLNLGATNLSKLTDEEKVIATNKGWTLT